MNMMCEDKIISSNNKELMDGLSAIEDYGRSGLLPALHLAHNLFGWVSEEVARLISDVLRVPIADIYGVIEFYSMFYSERVGKNIIRVCGDPACSMAGSYNILDDLCRTIGVELNSVSGDGKWTVEKVNCIGLCEYAPAALVGTKSHLDIQPKNFEWYLDSKPKPISRVYGDLRILTRNCGSGQTCDLSDYLSSGGYKSIEKMVKQFTPQMVIDEIKDSGLVGRGGAAFPTGIKWESAYLSEGSPKYVVCNADESEPGTFKDRILMEDDPHQVIEGMIIAGYAIGASKGYLYIRGEYFEAIDVMRNAIDDARCAGYLANNLYQSDFSFDIEVRCGAGAYIC
ncbi:MAG TPA: NADH-quinone oxidoreductase subunit E/F, partial [Chloroflexi bacterium]|nr:NADH-quinone oxidoreductase subunit E/F [Chloroflexota bacterium]